MTKIFVPRDTVALALEADALAAQIAHMGFESGVAVEIVRNSSRGMFFLEPLIEVATPEGRIGYGPVTLSDLPSLFAADFLNGGEHPLRIGLVERHPFLARQMRLMFVRAGVTDPLSMADYLENGGGRGLARAKALSGEQIVETILASGLRGRGGAGFPAGVKWRTVAQAPGDRKYVVCNADEGDSGTFADRMILEGDPFLLIEGMKIAALATGAAMGYVYSRSEYPLANQTFASALRLSREAGWLGEDAGFDIELRIGAGAYVCGEETALLESLEGRRGLVRVKPPLPALEGLFGQPTLINNVLSLASVPIILDKGAQFYAGLGMGRSRGTMAIQIAGCARFAGLFETPFGLTLGEIVEDIGGGTASGRPVRAVQCGGPLGAYFPKTLFDAPYDYEAFAARDGLIGHGGIVVFDDRVDMAKMAKFAMEFCAHESCGKCTPCRIGAVRGAETLDRILRGENVEANISLLEDLCETMKYGSLCALGGFTPYPVLSALRHFGQDFRA